MNISRLMICIITCTLWTAISSFSATSRAAGVCLESGHYTDVQGNHPRALDPPLGSGSYLTCKWKHEFPTQANRFAIYYNACEEQKKPIKKIGYEEILPVIGCDEGEKISHQAVEGIANYLECAWDLFLDPSMAPGSTLFKYPLDSPWMDFPGKGQVPVWILKHHGYAGANNSPWLMFPAHGRVHDPVTVNAVHEFGHIVVKAYPGYLAGGSVSLVNEGLPTFFEQVLRDEFRYTSPCGGKHFIDLSQSSLRSASYCAGTPFWNFVSGFSTAEIPDAYQETELTPSCRRYLSDLDTPPADGKMKHIVGRDVILAILNAFDQCYPLGLDTPACTQNGGYAAYCSLDAPHVDLSHRDAQGCQPNDQLFSTETEEEKRERLAARGEVAMPLAMEIIDGVIWRAGVGADQNPRYLDGVPNPIFRQYLEWNFERKGARGSSYIDASGYALKSFGAHYHLVDISSGAKTIVLEKEDDLPNWAYGIFYKARCRDKKNGRPFPTGLIEPIHFACQSELGAVAGRNKKEPERVSGWSNESSARIEIPADARFDTAVVIVTAFEGVYDPESGLDYASSAGHYQLRVER